MTDNSKNAILRRLNLNLSAFPDIESVDISSRDTINDPLEQFITQFRAAHGETRTTVSSDLHSVLSDIISEKKIQSLIKSSDLDLPGTVNPVLSDIKIFHFDTVIEVIKDNLFKINASLTSTYGGLASTGSLVIWPDDKEPRTMSLVPSIHIALLKKSRIFQDFDEMIGSQALSAKLPTNLILVSAPSRTADIEQTLITGVHGPKCVIAIILMDK